MRRTLRATGWLAAALCAATPAYAQSAAAGGSSGGPSLAQGAGGVVSLNTDAEAPGGRTRVGGALSYVTGPLEGLTAKLDVNLRAGDAPADGVLWPGAAVDASRPWSDLGVGLHADWTASPAARVVVDLTDRLFTRPVSPTVLGVEADAPRDARTEQSASLSAALQPAPQLALTVEGEVRSASDALDLASDAGGRALLKTRDGAVSAGLTWTPSPRLKLQASGRFTTAEVAWVEGASAAQDFAAVQPDLAATFSPWTAGSLSLSVARAVTPLDAAKFVTLARASAAGAPAGLRPDQEWRLQARFAQALPAASRLELGVTRAQLESSTELVRAGVDTEAPGSVAGGRRSQVEVRFDAPLDLIGARAVALQTRGVWRSSQITDPLTGAPRRISGETPYETSLALVQTLSHRGLVWGLNTHDQGAQSFYGLNQLSSVETARSLGAFFEYKPPAFAPGALALRLQFDDLAGGGRRWTDAYYLDGRDGGAVQRVDRRQEGGPGFTFSLRRAL